MCLRAAANTRRRCTISTCEGAGSVVVFWFDMLQQTCSRWETRQQDLAFFHRYLSTATDIQQHHNLRLCSFIGGETRLRRNSSVPAHDSLRLLIPSSLRLQINRIHAMSQLQPERLLYYPLGSHMPLPAPRLKIAYFSLQFSPRNSLNGLPSGIFRCHPAARSPRTT